MAQQEDMGLAGVSDVVTDWRAHMVTRNYFRLFGATHLHYWTVQLTRAASKDEVLAAFGSSSRIAPIRISDGLVALNSVKELMADRGRPHDNLYEVALWTDMLRVQGDELFYAYMVDNQAIVIPETIDAIRALTGAVRDGHESIARANAALGIESSLIGAGVGEPVHP